MKYTFCSNSSLRLRFYTQNKSGSSLNNLLPNILFIFNRYGVWPNKISLTVCLFGGPVFKESFQNLPPDPYISLYTWKTTACTILKHFDNFWTHLFVLKVCKNCHFSPKCPFSSIYFNHFLSKMRKNSLFIMIFRRLAIILAFTVLWAMKNEEMVNL